MSFVHYRQVEEVERPESGATIEGKFIEIANSSENFERVRLDSFITPIVQCSAEMQLNGKVPTSHEYGFVTSAD